MRKFLNIATATTATICLVFFLIAFWYNPQVSLANQVVASAEEWRQGVSKELWLTSSDGTRLSGLIESTASRLTLTPDGKRMSAVEEFKDVTLLLQEKLIVGTGGEKSQQVRFLKAAEGKYDFRSGIFTANNAEIALCTMPGHELVRTKTPKNSRIHGVAETVSVAMNERPPKIQAYNIEAHFPKERSTNKGSI